MYAIVDIAGQQFRIAQNDVIQTQKVAGDVGTSLELDKVMLLALEKETRIGGPYIEGAKIQATILEHGRDAKVIVFKKKRRKGYRVKNGHRQPYSKLRIDAISA
ncbi:50S ribosomal protein L21 [candidate division KSB1 bacterium]|nr:50S ribosomal protein L21 [candidate division KSB1 bacterium]